MENKAEETQKITLGNFEITAKVLRCQIPIGSLAVHNNKDYREKYPECPSLVVICKESNQGSIEEHWREVVSIKNFAPQQKPEIEWLSEDEINDMAIAKYEDFPDTESRNELRMTVFKLAANDVQARLQKRIKPAVDTVEFAEWFHVMRDAGELSKGRFTNDEIIEMYIETKTKK